MDEVRIDGSSGEGGGQVLRTALGLSVITQQPLRVTNVRANRPRPGLRPQHLAGLRLMAEFSQARVEGDAVGATEVRFVPTRPIEPGSYTAEVATAGSVTLMMQAAIPAVFFAPGRIRLTLRGGTDVPFSPTLDWMQHVYLPRIAAAAPNVKLEVQRRGFYPTGGGQVRLIVEGGVPREPSIDAIRDHVARTLGGDRTVQGDVAEAAGASVAHRDLANAHVAGRQARSARGLVAARGLPTPRINHAYVEADSLGSAAATWLVDTHGNRLGGDALGAPGRKAEQVGNAAARGLVEDWATNATVDRHLADHLVPWVAFGAAAVRVPSVTGHLETNIQVARAFLGEDSVRLADSILSHAPT